MCRGLALGIDKEMNIVCEGKRSHTDTGVDNGEYLKLELVIDTRTEKWYRLQVDEDLNDTSDEVCSMFLTKQNKLKKDAEKYILKHIEENKTQYLRWLLWNSMMEYLSGT